MLLKIVFTMLVIVCVWALSTKFRRTNGEGSEKQAGAEGVKTVKCAVCGVYLPREEAQQKNAEEYLCEQHRT